MIPTRRQIQEGLDVVCAARRAPYTKTIEGLYTLEMYRGSDFLYIRYHSLEGEWTIYDLLDNATSAEVQWALCEVVE